MALLAVYVLVLKEQVWAYRAVCLLESSRTLGKLQPMVLQGVECARYCFLLLVVWIVSPFKFILLSSDLVLFEFDELVHFFGFRISGIVFILFEVVGEAGGHR